MFKKIHPNGGLSKFNTLKQGQGGGGGGGGSSSKAEVLGPEIQDQGFQIKVWNLKLRFAF